MTTPAKRPFGRTLKILLIAAGAVALVLAGSVGLFVYSKTRPPKNQPDRYAAFMALFNAMQGEGEDSWPIYQDFLQGPGNPLWDASTGIAPLRVLEARARSANTLHQGAWDDPRHDETRAMLRESLVMLDALRAVTSRPGFDVMQPAPATPANPGHLGPLLLFDGWHDLADALRYIGYINAAAIRLDAAEGRWDRVAERVAFARAVALHTRSVPTVRFASSAKGIESGAIAEATQEVRERSPGRDAIDAILQAAGEPLDNASLMDDAIRGETLAVLDILHLLYTNGLSEPELRIPLLLSASFPETVRRVEDYFGGMRAWVAEPPSREVEPPDFDESFPERLRLSGQRIAGIVNPGVQGRLFRMRLQGTTVAADLLALRIERFKAENGRFPARLDDAATHEQVADPVSGEAFVYELSDNGQSYRLTLPASAEPWMSGYHLAARREPIKSHPLAVPADDDEEEQTP